MITPTDSSGIKIISNTEQDTPNDKNKANDVHDSLPLILDGTYFKVRNRSESNVSAECITCQKLIKGRLDATTNFRNHLKVSCVSIL